MEVSKKEEHKSKKFPQYFAGVAVAINMVSAGSVYGWTSPAMPQLQGSLLVQRNTTDLELEDMITPEEGSLVGSLLAVGALVGSLPAGHLANLLGRRRLTQAISMVLVIGWTIICLCGRQVVYLYLARFLFGMSLSCGSVVTPLYNEEISEVSVRGSLGVLYDAALTTGILWVYVAGAVMPYLWMNITSAVPAVVSFVLMFFIPESPVHLLIQGKDEAAKEALLWFRGKDFDVEPELTAMHRLVEKAREMSRADYWDSVKGLNLSSFLSPTSKSLFIMTGLMSVRQLSGINAITFYAEDIITGSGAGIDASLGAVLCGVFEFVVTILMVIVADLTGRRVLLVVSCWGCALSLVCLALGPPGWLPVVSTVGFVSIFSVGLGPVPFFMMPELVPTEAKGWVTGCVITINWVLLFLVTQYFVTMVNAFGTSNTYLGYGVVNAIAGLGILLFVPETKGKTLERIQKELDGRRRQSVS